MDVFGFYSTLQDIAASRGERGYRQGRYFDRSHRSGVKGALRAAAGGKHRSIANMVGVLIRDYCGRNGTVIPEQGSLVDENCQQRAEALWASGRKRRNGDEKDRE